ncbi:MAG TPA: hypothetical protein VGL81_07800 [Polyangiaceae bacterium]|jgi:uncharacterized protein (DUF1778 family)
MTETVKRRKPKAQRKEDQIRIRVTDAQKKILTDAATRSGLGVSSWLLSLGLREAQRSEGGGGE